MSRHNSASSSSWENVPQEDADEWLMNETMACLQTQNFQFQLQPSGMVPWPQQNLPSLLGEPTIASGGIVLPQHTEIVSQRSGSEGYSYLPSNRMLGSEITPWPSLNTHQGQATQISRPPNVPTLLPRSDSSPYCQSDHSSSSTPYTTLSTNGAESSDTDKTQKWQSERPRSLRKTRSKKNTLATQKVIEARYRTKLKDKILHLQHVVPTIRAKAQECVESNDGNLEDQDLHGLEPARNLKKGTIMTKTIEYINKLENDNQDLTNKLRQLEDKCTEISEQLAGLGTLKP